MSQRTATRWPREVPGRLRFEQGDEAAEEGDARRGVGVGRSVQMPVRGEYLAGTIAHNTFNDRNIS